MKNIYLLLLPLVFLISCSNKQYFEPKQTSNIKLNIINTPSYIKNITSSGATLENNSFLDKNGISKQKLKDGFFFINNSNNDIISANKKGELYINNKKFNFKSNVIAASLKGNLLALIFANNTIALYDLNTNTFKLKQYQEISYLNDTRIAMPLFLNNIVIFPSLNGKILIVDLINYEIAKTFHIDSISQVNNIILLKNIKNSLIVASSNSLVAISTNNIFKKEYFIQSFTSDENYLYIATLDGRILKLDNELNIIASKKFKFAKFQALSINNNYLLAIESQGYVVKISLDFNDVKIDNIPFENDEKVFSIKNKIYFEDKLLSF